MPQNSHIAEDDQGSGRLAESVSVKIPRRQGEIAIQLLARLNLLNKKLSPIMTNDAVVLPLVRTPQQDEKTEFEDLLGKQVFAKENFRIRSETFGSFEEVLAKQIPQSVIPLVSKSFDIIGDIAIIELSTSAEQFEGTIAESLMRVHKNVRTVYSKAGPITDTQRLRPLRHVLGEDRSQTIHREHGARFRVDLAKAFFSPRLSSEHKRVADQVESGETVLDMFAGVGPFSILIAKRLERVTVHAVDANPDAVRLIEENAKMNRVQEKITVWFGDARTVVQDHLTGWANRVIMNHPSNAKNFVGDAARAMKRSGGMVHYYTFAEGEDCESRARQEFSDSLANSEWKIDGFPATHRVRGVAPMKWQVVVDAKLVLS